MTEIKKSMEILKKQETNDCDFEGYLAVYDMVDDVGDMIHRGAFSEHLKSSSRFSLLYNHNDMDKSSIVGYFDAFDDEKGLYIKAKIFDDESNQNILKSIQVGAIKSLSIGMMANLEKAFYDPTEDVFHIMEATVKEGSVVHIPANKAATIDFVKKHYSNQLIIKNKLEEKPNGDTFVDPKKIETKKEKKIEKSEEGKFMSKTYLELTKSEVDAEEKNLDKDELKVTEDIRTANEVIESDETTIEEKEKARESVEESEREMQDIAKKREELEVQKGRLAVTSRPISTGNLSIYKGKNQTEKTNARVAEFLKSKEYETLWVRSIFRGEKAELKKAMTTIAGTAAGNFGEAIPTSIDQVWEKKIEDYGKLFGFVNRKFAKGITKKVIKYHSNKFGGVDEQASLPEGDPTAVAVLFQARRYGVFGFITEELEEMTDADIIAELKDSYMDDYLALMEEVIASGTLSADGRGVLGIIPQALDDTNDRATALYTGTEDLWKIGNTAYGLVRGTNTKAFMNRETFAALKNQTDDNNRPIFTEIGNTMTYGTAPIEFTDALPAITEAADGDAIILMGAEKSFELRGATSGNPKWNVDENSHAEDGETKVVCRTLVAGNIIRPASWVAVIKGLETAE